MKNVCLCKPFNWILIVILVIYLIYLIRNWKAPSLEFIPSQGLLQHQYNRLGNELTKTGFNQMGGALEINSIEEIVGKSSKASPVGEDHEGHADCKEDGTNLCLSSRTLGTAGIAGTSGTSGTSATSGTSGTSSGLKSITQDPNLFLNPNGGDNMCQVLGNAPGNFQCQFADPTLCSLSRGDQDSLAIAIKTGACFRGKYPTQSGSGSGSGPYGKTIDPARLSMPGCLPCRAREDLNYVSQTGSGITNNNILYPMDPRNSNQSELYSQFYRDVQNQLSEHSVENYRFPSWSTLTSSYRNDPQYCGIGDTVNQFIANDHCFDPVEYQSMQQINSGGAIKDAPTVINTQIANKNRRLRSQIVYTPVKTVDEIIPFNGHLNEKASNFTSELTRTFDWFTHASLGHVDALI